MMANRSTPLLSLLFLLLTIPVAEAIQDFVPLTCNANLGSCVSWSQTFGTQTQVASRIIVDCGKCITMDHPGPTLTLTAGIDIRGKLIFPDGYSLTLNTASITVQGVLEMTATKPVDGSPLIRIVMIGSDTAQTFTPVDANAAACAGDCKVGMKAITVAGGQVNRKYCTSTSSSIDCR
jgi:G8 domain